MPVRLVAVAFGAQDPAEPASFWSGLLGPDRTDFWVAPA